MGEEMTRAETDRVREVVGAFQNPEALEAAVDSLEVSGFDRAAISVLATDAKAKAQIDRFYQTLGALEDSSRATHASFVSRDSRTEGEAAAVGIPLYVGGLAGGAAVAAGGGALALAIAATAGGAVAGAGVGALLAGAIAHRHAVNVREQLRKGGLVLWVSVVDAEAEKRAIAILERAGAGDVHVHQVKDEPSLGDTRLPQADPFLLESDPVPPPPLADAVHGHLEYATARGNDYPAHEQMFHTFVTLTKSAVASIVVILILMAIFLA
jgi:hypothetical protein